MVLESRIRSRGRVLSYEMDEVLGKRATKMVVFSILNKMTYVNHSKLTDETYNLHKYLATTSRFLCLMFKCNVQRRLGVTFVY